MRQKHLFGQTTGTQGSIAGTILIGFGIIIMVYGIVAASWMVTDYRRLGYAYWDMLSSAELVLAHLWSVSYMLGSFLVLTGGVLRTGMESPRRWVFIGGGLVVMVLMARFPWPTDSSPFFGVGGSLILLFLLLTILNWSKRRRYLEGEAKTASDMRMAGYMFLAFAAFFTCGLGTENTFLLYPDQATHARMQAKAVGLLYRIMSLFVLGWLFIYLSQRAATQLVGGESE
jgi:hypothetical protein